MVRNSQLGQSKAAYTKGRDQLAAPFVTPPDRVLIRPAIVVDYSLLRMVAIVVGVAVHVRK